MDGLSLHLAKGRRACSRSCSSLNDRMGERGGQRRFKGIGYASCLLFAYAMHFDVSHAASCKEALLSWGLVYTSCSIAL